MKKLLFAAYSLDLGGIEKALITLTNRLKEKGYDITIVLEKKQGIFLNELDKEIKVIEYRPSENKNIIKRKLSNLLKRINFIFKYRNKFDFSACFATYSNAAAFIARQASKNSCIWGHADYLTLFNGDESKLKKFFEDKKINSFQHIIFVSNEGKDSFIKVFPNLKTRAIVCNNLIDGNKINELSKEQIDMKKENDKITFLNVGRHEERQKRLTKIIEVAKRLKKENYNFRIIFVGDGPDSEMYKSLVKQEKLTNEIIFVGKKKNPYPYFMISDCVILTSDYEGYPVVFLESFILKKPIITTKVSDYEEVKGRGLVTSKDIEDIYRKMKIFIEEGYKIERNFDFNQYNQEIIQKIEQLF